VEIAIIGLGRMGANIARRLLRHGHRVVAFNRTPAKTLELASEGAEPAFSLAELAAKLQRPRHVWIMVPAGQPVDDMINDLIPHLETGDTLIDGGNSNFRDSMRRAQQLTAKGIEFMDIGTSGGIWGLERGYCLMVGGSRQAFERLEPLLRDLATDDGYAYVGTHGAGHFVKMVHNGIEYGLLQAYGEGFEILKASPFGLDLRAIAHLWNHGSVVRSWLLELAEAAFGKDPDLTSIRGWVEDSGEGRWTVSEAIEMAVPAPVIALSLFMRFRSRQEDSFAGKVIAALRREFGGHPVMESGE
jgi:6-phosphogluconate dehydrogenase